MSKFIPVLLLSFLSFFATAQNCPTVGFTYNNFQANGGNTSYTFISNSTVPAGTMSYLWTFGDPTTGANDTSTIVNPLHIFSALGTYIVTLKVTNDLDGCSTVSTQTVIVPTVVVAIPPAPPVSNDCPSVAFYVSGNTNLGESTTFTNTSSVGSGSLVYSWNFGDAGSGSNNTSSLDNPTHIFSGVGNFITTLIATNSVTGCKDSISKTVTIGAAVVVVPPTPTPPTVVCAVVDFNALANTTNGDSYTFISTSTISTGNMTYFWDLGNGTSSTLINPTVTYATLGSYIVKLIVTSSTGCVDSLSKTITVSAAPVVVPPVVTLPSIDCPVAAFYVSGNTNLGESTTLTNTSTVGSGSLVYSWSFGDAASGASNTSALANPTHIYSGVGNFIIKLIATNSVTGCKDSISKTVTIGNAVVVVPPVVTPPVVVCPVVSFNSLATTNSGNSYTFISTSTIASGNMTYFWNLGNNTTSTLSNPTVTYLTPGNYTVKLVVTSSTGCSDSTSKVITYCAKTTASFGVTSNGVCANNNSFAFANTSTNTAGSSATTYAWSFGDGTNSTSATPAAKVYAVAGEYNVKLIATLIDNGCTSVDSTTQVVSVNPVPVPVYVLYLDTDLTSIDQMKRCFRPGIDFSFISNSTITKGQMNYKWTFGTTDFSFRDPGDTKVNARMVFNIPGTFPVKLVVTSDKGCRDSITRNVYLSKAVSSFTTNITPDPLGDIRRPSISFNNNSTDIGASTSLSNSWTYGAALTATNITYVPFTPSVFTPSPNKLAKGGNYTTTLAVTNDFGCTNSSTQPLTFYVRPEAAFTLGTTVDGSTGLTFVSIATNTTTVDETPATLTYAWSFGDGSPIATTLFPAAHTYTTEGLKTVTLTVTNTNGGLVSTTTRNVTVTFPTPVANIAASLSSSVPTIMNVNFDASHSSNPSTISSGSITGYNWSVVVKQKSDNSVISSTNVLASTGSVAFNENDYYATITLTVTSNLGKVSTATADINNGAPSGYTTFRSVGRPQTLTPIFDKPSVQIISTKPNPASNRVAFSFNAVSSSTKLQIVDLMGRVVLQQTQATVNGARNASIVDISGIANGSYLVKITDNLGVLIATSKFLKQ